jgi:hypothetical protein
MERDYIIQQPIAKDLIAHPKLLLHQSKHEALESTCHKFQKSLFLCYFVSKNYICLGCSLLIAVFPTKDVKFGLIPYGYYWDSCTNWHHSLYGRVTSLSPCEGERCDNWELVKCQRGSLTLHTTLISFKKRH